MLNRLTLHYGKEKQRAKEQMNSITDSKQKVAQASQATRDAVRMQIEGFKNQIEEAKMLKDLLKESAQNRAEYILKSSKATAEEIVSDAKEQYEQSLKDFGSQNADAVELAKSILSSANDQAEKIAMTAASQAEYVLTSADASARKVVDDAVQQYQKAEKLFNIYTAKVGETFEHDVSRQKLAMEEKTRIDFMASEHQTEWKRASKRNLKVAKQEIRKARRQRKNLEKQQEKALKIANLNISKWTKELKAVMYEMDQQYRESTQTGSTQSVDPEQVGEFMRYNLL